MKHRNALCLAWAVPVFTLAGCADVPRTIALTPPSVDSPGVSGQLSVKVSFGALDARAVMATLADVDHITIRLEMDQLDANQTISRPSFAAGSGTATFGGLPDGQATVSATVYSARNIVIGSSSANVTVRQKQTSKVDLVIQLVEDSGAITTTVKVVDPNQIFVLAGSSATGSVDAIGTSARFSGPVGLATDLNGNLFVADMGNNLIRRVLPDGSVTTFAGSGRRGLKNGPAALSEFDKPRDVAVDKDGNVYVADYNNRVIRKISASGEVSTLMDSNYPVSLAFNSAGELIIGENGFNLIRKRGSDGFVSTVVSGGILWPLGVAADATGKVYIADSGNHRIRALSSSGVLSTFAGSSATGSIDGIGDAARFDNPVGIALDAQSNIYVADTGAAGLRKITPAGGVSTLSNSLLGSPGDVALDTAGNIFLTIGNQIQKISLGAIN